ncbi:M14 family metallopeptidase [Thalassotalea ganghwensis]
MITISSNFEGGAIEVVEADSASNIIVNIKKDNQACTRQWFYFSVSTQQAEQQHITIRNASEVSFSKAWQDYQAFASYDNQSWFRVTTSFDGDKLHLNLLAERSTVYYAYFVPYPLTRQKQLVDSIKRSPLVSSIPLPNSPLGQTMEILRFGKPSQSTKNVWIIARQHPGETMAQWVIEGSINALLDNTPLTESQHEYVFYLVANMNPDGTLLGNHRTNALGKNLNRCWDEACAEQCPEVFYVQKAMAEIGVDFFFDLHGDEEIPYNFIMSKGHDESAQSVKQELAKRSANFQTEYDYNSFQTGCGTSCCSANKSKAKTATGYVTEHFNVPSLLLEASFKPLQNSGASETWDHLECIKLGEQLINTVFQVPNTLASHNNESSGKCGCS